MFPNHFLTFTYHFNFQIEPSELGFGEVDLAAAETPGPDGAVSATPAPEGTAEAPSGTPAAEAAETPAPEEEKGGKSKTMYWYTDIY